MEDSALGFLREAKAALHEECDSGLSSRETSIVLTNIDTAILWRQEYLNRIKPTRDEEAG